jgi:hypothetical protein
MIGLSNRFEGGLDRLTARGPGQRLAAVLVLAFASAACPHDEGGPAAPDSTATTSTTTTSITSSPPPAASNCGDAPNVVTAPPPGATLESGQKSTFTQGGTYLLPEGDLRLETSGFGRVVLSAGADSIMGNAGFTQDFSGPASLLLEPNPTQSITIFLCTR